MGRITSLAEKCIRNVRRSVAARELLVRPPLPGRSAVGSSHATSRRIPSHVDDKSEVPSTSFDAVVYASLRRRAGNASHVASRFRLTGETT